MIKFLIHLLESSAVLALLYFFYLLALRKETFFNVNRFFLLAILAFSIAFPWLTLDLGGSKISTLDQSINEINKVRASYYESIAFFEFELVNGENKGGFVPSGNLVSSTPNFDWKLFVWWFLLIVYFVGVVFCYSRFVLTLLWLRKLKKRYPKQQFNEVSVVKVREPIAPFSFLNYMFVHDQMVGTEEFQQVLKHEETHIQQRHSIDLIFVQLLAALLWFNPLVWQLIKSLKTTHEYIADQKILNSGYSLVEYQALLLRQLISNNSYGLVHNFNLSFIKKRIIMMKSNQSGWSGKMKVAIAILFTVVSGILLVQCNSRIEEQISVTPEESQVANLSAADLNLPILPSSGFTFNGSEEDVLNLSIKGDVISLDGQVHSIDELEQGLIDSGLSPQGAVIVSIDKAQKMGLVREAFTLLRRTNKRKLLYIGTTSQGERVELPFLLPPLPGDPMPNGKPLPIIDEAYIAATGIDVMKVKLGDDRQALNQQEVYDFVMKHVHSQSANYVVSASFSDEDTYDQYLVNLNYIQEGFNQIYEERAQEMFQKGFYNLDKTEYRAVRQGIPKAISVAES